MAKKEKKTVSKRMWLIDPIYRKFTSKAFQAMTSGEFYSFFQQMLMNGEHTFQFSNRKLKLDVDEKWVKIIEDTIPAFIEITRNPRVLITQEELITNVVQAKRIDSQVVRHLCAHSYLIDAIDEKGEVRPNKVLNILKEETWDTYENRFVYTLLKKAYDFVSKRYMDMQECMNDEFGARLNIKSTANSDMETMEIESKMYIRQVDELFDSDDRKKSIFARIKYIYEMLARLMETRFAKEMKKYQIVRPPLVPTNAIKKNPYLRTCQKLWNFLLTYNDVGFTVQIIEQNPEINQKFEQDIFNNIMFTYIILKGYLEDNRDRALDRSVPARRRTLKPKYIREIIEELVRDFNLPDVEVRKILIEQLTREQLMREERSDRYRILEENQRAELEEKRREEQRRLQEKKEKEKEKRRLEREKKLEKARQEREKIKAAEKQEKEKVRQGVADARRGELFEEEILRQLEAVNARRQKQAEAAEKQKSKAAAKKSPARPKTSSARKAPPKSKPKTPKTASGTAVAETVQAENLVQQAEQTASAIPETPVEQVISETAAAPIIEAAPPLEETQISGEITETEAAAEPELVPEIEVIPEPEAETIEETEAPAEPDTAERIQRLAALIEEMPETESAVPIDTEEPAETENRASEQDRTEERSGFVRNISQLFRRKR